MADWLYAGKRKVSRGKPSADVQTFTQPDRQILPHGELTPSLESKRIDIRCGEMKGNHLVGRGGGVHGLDSGKSYQPGFRESNSRNSGNRTSIIVESSSQDSENLMGIIQGI